jgi:hypothetical protein
MHHSFVQQDSEPQKPGGLVAINLGFKIILSRLVSLVKLSEQELEEAGVLIGYKQDEKNKIEPELLNT